MKWFFVLLLVMVAFSLRPYRIRFSVTAMSTRKYMCAVGVDDESLALLDILDDDFFGGDSDVSDTASGSADSDSDEDSDLEPRARVCGDENSKAGGSVDENVVFVVTSKIIFSNT